MIAKGIMKARHSPLHYRHFIMMCVSDVHCEEGGNRFKGFKNRLICVYVFSMHGLERT